jgi:hypothetical protein
VAAAAADILAEEALLVDLEQVGVALAVEQTGSMV